MIENLEKIDGVIEPMLRAARIPGAAIAIVIGDKIAFSKGYGYRDLDARLPMTSGTIYPVASTTKAINATLLGMLVDEDRLAWDAPVQTYLPWFNLRDPCIGSQVTIRDLITMRTGLPRHDWLWIENPMDRAELVRRLRYLEPSATFRGRFQYNNLTVTTAGHVAEAVTGQRWEDMARDRILEPLGMRSSGFDTSNSGNAMVSYHENSDRDLRVSRRFATDVTAPSGGALHSTVEDMARWISFNLNDGCVQGRQLVQKRTLAEIHSPQVVVGEDTSAPTPQATYAMGWFVDAYNGCPRVSHGGYLHDVNSEVTFFPKHQVGIVSFTNFGCPTLARLINQQAFDLLHGLTFAQSLEDKITQYEQKIEETRRRNTAVPRVAQTSPSHPLDSYAGHYVNAAYGRIEILRDGDELALQRHGLLLQLEHWHYDAWVAKNTEFFAIHMAHAFDRASRLLFETNADGEVVTLTVRLEPTVAPIRFERVPG